MENGLSMRNAWMVILLLLLIPSSLAVTTYTETGYYNNTFSGGNSLFNAQLSAPVSYTGSISTPHSTALVADLDNDGINEIVAVSANTIRIYSNKALAVENSYTIPTSEVYSNFVLFDIDGDNKTEIIFARDASHDIIIVEYNGSAPFNQSSISYDDSNSADGETMLKCGAINNCMIAYVGDKDTTANQNVTFAVFNSTAIAQKQNFRSGGLAGEAATMYCTPRVKEVSYKDLNGGIPEYVFTLGNIQNTGGNINTTTFAFTATSMASLTKVSQFGQVNDIDIGFSSCDTTGDNPPQSFFTAPLVMDTDGGGFNEIVEGISSSQEEFSLYVFDLNGVTQNSHPLVTTSDGKMLSNPIKMNAFPSDKEVLTDKKTDYCVMGFQKNTRVLNLLCGSSRYSRNLQDTMQYFANYSTYNVSTAYDVQNVISHSMQSNNDQEDNDNNMDELVASYGVFKLALDNNFAASSFTCGLFNECLLERIFANPFEQSAIIPVDFERNGNDDLIGVQAANIYYLDDGFTNSAPNFTSIKIFPCTDQAWDLNTTVQVIMRAVDSNLDNIAYKFVLYDGTVNAVDTGYSAFVASGTQVTLTSLANVTAGGATLTISVKDVNNNTRTNTQVFSVFEGGVDLTDCSTDVTFQSLTNTTINESTTNPNNVISRTLDPIGNHFGLGRDIIWLTIMIVAGVGLFFGISHKYPHSPSVALIGTGFMEVLALIIGTKLDFLGFGTLLVIIIISVTAIGFYLRNKVTGTGHG